MEGSRGTATGGRVLLASGERFALATPHVLATEAGARAFEQGGNALDAALAAAAMLAVVYPDQCSAGGDLFAVVSAPDGRQTVVNGSGAAPLGMNPKDVDPRETAMPLRGPLTITVPGVVAAWEALAALGSRRGLPAALAEAVPAAAEGIPVAPGLARAIRKLVPTLTRDPGMAEVFLPEGEPLAEGSTLRQSALAGTLEAVARGGAEALYRGEVGDRLARGLQALGSPITNGDLAAHETQFVRPLTGRYRGHEIVTAPPNSQGFVLLQILAALERLDGEIDPLGSSAGAVAEVFRLASEDRDRWLSDSRRRAVPLDELLGEEHVDELARRAREAVEGPVEGQGLPRAGRGEGAGRQRSPEPPRHRGDTVAVVAADAEGHAVSLIQSVFEAFGSGILEPSTGLILHNRGTSFSLDPAHPAALEGGVRPPHTLTPVLALDPGGRVETVVGTMGGPAQPQILAQVLVRLLDQGADPDVAVSAPRWIVRHSEPRIVAEPAAAKALSRSGRLRIEVTGADEEETGHAQAIVIAEAGLTAGSDPRADGAAAAG
ncbi:MAG: gamma-glutamyltransferase family protein [Actinomycetota bacterium]